MNLYVYGSEVVCGARVVMPADAAFIVHIPPDKLQNGFSEKEWELIVEKTREIIGTEELAATAAKTLRHVRQNQLQRRIEANQSRFQEHRREQRLRYRRPIEFCRDSSETFTQAYMVDVCSNGMAFTCHATRDCPSTGQQLTTRFTVPRFYGDGSFDAVDFSRVGCTCRVDDVNRFLRRVAIQFAKPLPFRPAERPFNDSCAQKGPNAQPYAGVGHRQTLN
jgi:hypothetical protein